MTLSEFLAALNATYSRVGVHKPATNQIDFDLRKAEMGYSFYAIPVDDITTIDGIEVSKTGTVFFKVYDEGLPQERIVREEKLEPKFQARPADTVFEDQVKVWYTTNKPSNIVKFQLLETNKDLKFAIVRVFEVAASVATEKKVFIFKEGATITAVPLG